MSTVRDLLTEALLILGVIADGEVPSASQAAGGQRVLFSLMDSWALEGLLVYTRDRQLFPLQGNTQTYTLGPGGMWDTTPLYGPTVPRPVRIESAYWQDPTSGVELPIEQMGDEEYQGLILRNTPGNIILRFYYNSSFPLGEVFVWPNPGLTANLVLYLWHPFDATLTLDTVVSFPQGYQRMLEYNLAQEWSTRFPGTLREDIATLARDSKAWVKKQNAASPLMGSDAAMVTQNTSKAGLYAWPQFLSDRG